MLYGAESNDETGHAYAVVEWVDGIRLEEAYKDAARADVTRIGEAVGLALAAIHTVPFPETGLIDSTLTVVQPIAVSGHGIAGYLRDSLFKGPGQSRIDRDIAERAVRFANEAGTLVDTWRPPATLTHADFGGSNILIDRVDGQPRVSGVVDWEFAFAGSPLFDLGNLLRPPLGDVEGFADAVARGYRSAGGELPEDWRAMSLLVDLTAWAEFLSRPTLSDGIVESARRRLEETMDWWARAYDAH